MVCCEILTWIQAELFYKHRFVCLCDFLPQTSLPGACEKWNIADFQSDQIYAAWIVGGIPVYAVISSSLEALHKGLHMSAVDIVDNQLNISIFW